MGLGGGGEGGIIWVGWGVISVVLTSSPAIINLSMLPFSLMLFSIIFKTEYIDRYCQALHVESALATWIHFQGHKRYEKISCSGLLFPMHVNCAFALLPIHTVEAWHSLLQVR